MANLYVRNVPDELYEALRRRAREHHRSIAAEVLVLLEENIPTAKELRGRRKLLRELEKMQSAMASSPSPIRSMEEMLAEDRAR
jgi:plasmid stability protein